MSFLSLIFKNPFRNKSRTVLAIIGIGIGIATIVALGAITDGLINSAEDTLHTGGADFTVTGKETVGSQAGSFGTSSIEESWLDKILAIKGVDSAVGIYSGVAISNNNYFPIVGVNPKDVSYADLHIIEGKIFNKNGSKELIIGKVVAEKDDIKVGDSVDLGLEKYKVVGIFESGNPNQDMSCFMNLKNAQKVMHAENNYTSIFVKVDKDVDVDKVTNEIESKYGNNLTTISSLSDLAMVKDMVDMLNGASLGISILAVIIGAVGIVNTMLMSVLERTREIGVLKAVGWSSKRILSMIIGESVVITITAGIIGSIVGTLGVELFSALNLLGGMTPIFTIFTFAEAFLVAIFVGIIGGIYPAIKAVNLPPTEALRYE